MRRLLVGLALFACLAAPSESHAGPGVALGWNHCFGEGTGSIVRAFACDTNAGFEELVGSFALTEDMPAVSGNEIVVDVFSGFPYVTLPGPPSGTPLPAWWRFVDAGSCRATSLTISTVMNPDDAVCQPWAGGLGVSAIASYRIDPITSARARIHAVVAVPQASLASLVKGQEYYSFTLRIDHKRTVGDGACGGCGNDAYLVFNSIKVTTPTPADDRLVAGPLDGVSADLVIWEPTSPVPARHTSWAALKSRFR